MVRVPFIREIPFRDPLRAFAPLAARPCAVFLDSAAEAGARGRYSAIAADPFLVLSSKNGRIVLGERRFSGDPFAVLAATLARFRLAKIPGLPPFQGGAAGFFSYDLCHHLERLPAPRRDDLAFPDLVLGFYDVACTFDLVDRRAWIVSSGFPETDEARAARWAAKRADALFESLGGEDDEGAVAAPGAPPEAPSWTADFDRRGYERAVQRVIDYIHAGDVFQANISRRVATTLAPAMTPFDLYRRLRILNPAPFASYVKHADVVLASASPERFLKIEGGCVETRPIKGTRRRASKPEDDAKAAHALLESEKDRAENVMIVDVLRNDLSRACRAHSVKTPEICVLESFATVHHLVSTVTGALDPGVGPVELLRVAFPGGSITGAPKIRAMEIIAEIEPVRRGPYCGCIGYIGFDGTMDSAITIRAFALKGRTVTFHVGGGIVADSSPEEEYEETLTKARALFACLGPEDPFA